MGDVIVNKVAESGLITLDLEDYLPSEPIHSFDLKDYLFRGLILKEKEFRDALQQINWQQYKDQYVAVHCSAEAIIPAWAYMLVASNLQPVARDVYSGPADEMKKYLLLKNIQLINAGEYNDKRVVIKGCGDVSIGEFAFLEITKKLRPVVKSLMYGEPCSTVPVYKKTTAPVTKRE
jgi:hypothetical protein